MYDAPFTSQSFLFETRNCTNCESTSDTVHARLLELPFRRHHLACDRPVEQRGAGMGAGQYFCPARSLQPLQRAVRDRLAPAQLGKFDFNRLILRDASLRAVSQDEDSDSPCD